MKFLNFLFSLLLLISFEFIIGDTKIESKIDLAFNELTNNFSIVFINKLDLDSDFQIKDKNDVDKISQNDNLIKIRYLQNVKNMINPNLFIFIGNIINSDYIKYDQKNNENKNEFEVDLLNNSDFINSQYESDFLNFNKLFQNSKSKFIHFPFYDDVTNNFKEIFTKNLLNYHIKSKFHSNIKFFHSDYYKYGFDNSDINNRNYYVFVHSSISNDKLRKVSLIIWFISGSNWLNWFEKNLFLIEKEFGYIPSGIIISNGTIIKNLYYWKLKTSNVIGDISFLCSNSNFTNRDLIDKFDINYNFSNHLNEVLVNSNITKIYMFDNSKDNNHCVQSTIEICNNSKTFSINKSNQLKFIKTNVLEIFEYEIKENEKSSMKSNIINLDFYKYTLDGEYNINEINDLPYFVGFYN